MAYEVVPLAERKKDYWYLGFFFLNIFLICPLVDLEQLIITDPYDPNDRWIWPPAPWLDILHWYGHNLDPVLMARPAWWRATIWIDQVFFFPFYFFAVYAFIKGKEWIRFPAIIYGVSICCMVYVIMFEEFLGEHATPHPVYVTLLNMPWFFFPAAIVCKMIHNDHPFSKKIKSSKKNGATKKKN